MYTKSLYNTILIVQVIILYWHTNLFKVYKYSYRILISIGLTGIKFLVTVQVKLSSKLVAIYNIYIYIYDYNTIEYLSFLAIIIACIVCIME